MTFTDLANVDPLAISKKAAANTVSEKPQFPSAAVMAAAPKNTEKDNLQVINYLLLLYSVIYILIVLNKVDDTFVKLVTL